MCYAIDTKLKITLKHLQQRAGVAFAKRITHQDISELAGVNKRAVDEWMRGGVAPPAMVAVFELLSKLPEEDALAILNFWKTH